MAEAKQGVRLWGPEGGTFDEVEIPAGDAQPDVVQHDGKIYVWNQRNGQYREATVAKASAAKGGADLAAATGADSARPATAGDLASAHEAKPSGTGADVKGPEKKP